MSHRATMVGIVIGGGLYQLAKVLLGYPPTFMTYFDSLYWGGGALLTHWFACKMAQS